MNSKMMLGCLLASAGAVGHAQTPNLTLYGLIDTGVEYVTDVGPAGDSLTRMPTITGTLPSRWGVRGSEDLGGGQRAVFTLENGFAPDSGSLNYGGRLFGRQAFVGLSGTWGALTFGRQYTMFYWSLLDSDLLGPNVYGSGSIDSYIPNARADNSVAYRGTFGGVTVGASYSVGRDAVATALPTPSSTNCAGESATDKRACREWSAMVKYDASNWGAAVAYDRLNGGPGAFANLTGSSLNDSRATLNGYVKFGDAKLGAGVIRRRNEAAPAVVTGARNNLWYLAAVYPLTPALTLDGELFRLDVKDSPNEATMLAVRGTYSFSKRTAAYITAGHIRNDGALNLSVSSGAAGSNPVAGDNQSGFMLGIRHTF
jgi:predicted porin